MMDLKNYQIFCEDFFKQKIFQSNESLTSEIKNLNVVDFKNWQDQMFLDYNEKYNVVLNLIADIRIRENFDINSQAVDWDQDPIKQEHNRIIVKSYKEVYNNNFDNNIAKYKIYEEKCNELLNYMQDLKYQESIKISVNGKDFIAKKVINVLWSGWECDSAAWLVEDNGVNKLVTTNHGHANFTDKSFLEEKLKEYQQAIKETQELLSKLN